MVLLWTYRKEKLGIEILFSWVKELVENVTSKNLLILIKRIKCDLIIKLII